MDADGSRQPVDVESNAAANILHPTPAAVSRRKARPADGRSTATAISIGGIAMEEVPRGCYIYALCGIDRRKRIWGNCLSQFISSIIIIVHGEDDADDISSPELRGWAARELRRLGENPIVLQERTRGAQKKRLDMGSVTLFVEEALANEEKREWLSVYVIHDRLTVTDDCC